MKRRDILAGMGGLAAATALSGTSTTNAWAKPQTPEVAVPYTLHLVGPLGNAHVSTGLLGFGTQSIAQRINLQTGEITQHPFPTDACHYPLILPDGRLFVTSRGFNRGAFVSADGQSTKTFDLNKYENLNFGGHALYDSEKNVIYASMALATDNPDSSGFIGVFDADKQELAHLQPMPNNNTHEILFLPGNEEIALTGYAGLYSEHGSSRKRGWLAFPAAHSQVTIVDRSTLQPKRHYKMEEYKASLGHMTVDKDGYLYLDAFQSITGHPKNDADVQEIRKVAEEFIGERTWTLHPDEGVELGRGMMVPMPVLRINPQTGEVKPIWAEDKGYHRYPLSFTYSDKLDRVFVTHMLSNKLFIITPPGDTVEVMDGWEDLGFHKISGARAVPGTPYIALCDFNYGVVLLDGATRKIVARYGVPTFGTEHMTIRPLV
ncbi:MAG: DUF1513 domain-containing protein [Proteobacteria bacterium]|nr:DUF1513 domain-containing protein [Pseudomonadota bacterium]